ncbi:MAG: hypothetical protein ACK5V3_06110 [Bdellovibrionales bacterium]
MSFKINWLVPMALPFVLASCTPEIGEQPPEPANIELGVTKCMSKSAQDLKAFFSAEVSDGDLMRAWSCVEAAFNQFDKYVVGKDKDRYTSQEIVDFIETNFFENDGSTGGIHKELQVEVMKLKQIFVGGSREFVTREELKKSQVFMRQISEMTVKVNPFMKIIIMNWNPVIESGRNADLELFEKSNLVFQLFAKELAEVIQKHDSKYQLTDVVGLIEEFQKFFKEEWLWIEDIKKIIPAAQKLKKSLAGGDENTITNREWPPVLTLTARGYYQYLRYHYFIKTTPQTGGGIRLVYLARTLEDVFSILQDLLIQKDSGVILKSELFETLEAFEQVWPELKFSEKLVSEVMKIKQLLVGGSAENWTARDFETARLKVPELRRIVENFLTYYSVYAFDWEPEVEGTDRARKYFEEARSRLYVVGQDLSRFLQGSYSFQDLLALAEEIESLYPPKNNDNQNQKALTQSIKKYEALFFEINKLLFNRNDTVVEEKSWTILIPLIARTYSLFQFYDYFLLDQSFKKSQPLLDLGTLVDHGIVFMTDLLKSSPNARLSDEEIVRVLLAVQKTSLLPEKLSENTFRSVTKAVLQHFLFDPERRLKGEKNQHFSTDQLGLLRAEFRNWMLTQVKLNELFSNDSELEFLPNELLKKLKDQIVQLNEDQSVLKLGLQEVFNLLDASVSQTHDAEDQLQISNKVDWKYKLNSVFNANLNRFLSRLIIRSFSSEKTLTKIETCDAEKMFQLLIGLFRELNIFDPAEGFIGSRFLEANMFMLRANGDKYVDFFELGELAGVLLSGLKVNSKLESSVRKVCPVYKDKDGKEFIVFRCLSEHHYVAVRKYMAHMPEFKNFVERLAAKDPPVKSDNEFIGVASRPGFVEWNAIFKAVMKATGWKSNSGYGSINQESVYLSGIVYYPFVINYLEYVFARFDATKNAALQVFEAQRAFPVFRGLLKDLAQKEIDSGTIKESDLWAVFTYVLKYKEQPSADGLGNIARWLWWRSQPSRWDLWVTRAEMSVILGYISEKAGKDEDSSDEKPEENVCRL